MPRRGMGSALIAGRWGFGREGEDREGEGEI